MPEPAVSTEAEPTEGREPHRRGQLRRSSVCRLPQDDQVCARFRERGVVGVHFHVGAAQTVQKASCETAMAMEGTGTCAGAAK